MEAEEKLPPSAYSEAEISRHYDNFDVSQGRYKFILSEMAPNSKVLEIGCFLGRYCNHFASLGHEPVGVDISPKVIEEAKRLFPAIPFHCCDGKEFSQLFEAGSFDAVVASEVIEHVLYPQDFLNEIVKVLKPGGKLLLTTQNSNAFHFRMRMLFGKFRWDPTHLRLYSKEELRDEIEKGGFQIQKMQGIAINPKGPQQFVRRIAWLSNFVNPNFCWTWGVVATPKPG